MFINYYCVYPPILSSIQWSAAALERTSPDQRLITHKSTVDKRRKGGRRRRTPSHVIAVNPSAVLSSGTGQVVDEERMVAEVYQESCPRSPFIRHTLFLGHYRNPHPHPHSLPLLLLEDPQVLLMCRRPLTCWESSDTQQEGEELDGWQLKWLSVFR